MKALLAERGVPAAAFRARQLVEEDLSADLIITMSERQRRVLLDEAPSAGRRVGLLGHVAELAAISGDTEQGVTRARISEWTRMSKPAGRDIVDPYRRSAEIAQGSAATIESYVRQLATFLILKS